MVHKMMAKDRDRRYQSAREIVRDLVKLREGLQAASLQISASQPVALHDGGRLAASAEPLSLPESDELGVPPAEPRPRWWRGRWPLAALACALAAGAGAGAYAMRHALSKPPARAEPAPGLPDVRLPDRPTTTRERELLAVLNTEGTRHDDAIRASVELGLLYVRENRLDEATARFERLKGKAADWRDFQAARTAGVAGRLGLAVVLAHENRAEASNRLFLDVVGEQRPKLDRTGATVHSALMRYPDLSQAVAEALGRNAANLGKSKLEPAALEQLRNPQRAGKKE
jgi:serine/threonine-protein kinase